MWSMLENTRRPCVSSASQRLGCVHCVHCVHCALASAFEFAETDLKGDEYEPIIEGNWLSNALCRHSESGKGMMMIARNEEKSDTHDCRRLITLAGTCRRTSTWIFHLFPGRLFEHPMRWWIENLQGTPNPFGEHWVCSSFFSPLSEQ